MADSRLNATSFNHFFHDVDGKVPDGNAICNVVFVDVEIGVAGVLEFGHAFEDAIGSFRVFAAARDH